MAAVPIKPDRLGLPWDNKTLHIHGNGVSNHSELAPKVTKNKKQMADLGIYISASFAILKSYIKCLMKMINEDGARLQNIHIESVNCFLFY